MKNLLCFLLFFSISFNVSAEWKKETYKSSKGESQTFYINSLGKNIDLVVDMQQQIVYFTHKGKVLNGVDGVKFDGVFYDLTGKGIGDSFDAVIFLRKGYISDKWVELSVAKKIEINVDYFRLGNKVHAFYASKSLKELFPKDFPSPLSISETDKCKDIENLKDRANKIGNHAGVQAYENEYKDCLNNMSK